MGAFGEHIIFHLPCFGAGVAFDTLITPTNAPNDILDYNGEQIHPAGATQEISSGTVATPIVDLKWERLFDLGAWLLGITCVVLARVVTGGGNTMTYSGQLIVTARTPGKPDIEIYNQTVSLAGVTTNIIPKFVFPQAGTRFLIPQNTKLIVEIILTGTRTAGAATSTIFYKSIHSTGDTSFINFHVLPHRTNDITYGTEKTT